MRKRFLAKPAHIPKFAQSVTKLLPTSLTRIETRHVAYGRDLMTIRRQTMSSSFTLRFALNARELAPSLGGTLNRLLFLPVFIAAGVLSACGGGSNETFPLKGEITIQSGLNVQNIDNVHCSGRDGYSDLADGASVVVQDEAGLVLGKTTLESKFERLGPESVKCHFTFSVAVPDEEKFYQLSIGSRDPYVASAEEAKGGLNLTIG